MKLKGKEQIRCRERNYLRLLDFWELGGWQAGSLGLQAPPWEARTIVLGWRKHLKWTCSASGGKTLPTGRCWPAWEEGRAIKTQLRESTQAFPTSELSSSLFRKTFPGYMKRISWTVFLIQAEKVSTLDWSNQRVGPDICLGKFRKCLKQSLFPPCSAKKIEPVNCLRKESSGHVGSKQDSVNSRLYLLPLEFCAPAVQQHRAVQ